MSPGQDRFRELCAGRALGTLTDDERWELAELMVDATPQMLRFCDELEYAALHLPAAAELVEPPAHVRTGLLEAVRAERSGKEPASPKRRVASRLGLTRPRIALAAVTVLAAVAVGLGLYSASLHQAAVRAETRAFNLTDDLEKRDRLLRVLESRRVEVVALESIEDSPETYGKLIWDQENQVAVLQVANLPPAPEGSVYQLWVFARDRDPTSAGVFIVNDPERDTFFRFDGFTPVDRPSISGYLVTLEPEGGAEAPSESRLLGARVGS